MDHKRLSCRIYIVALETIWKYRVNIEVGLFAVVVAAVSRVSRTLHSVSYRYGTSSINFNRPMDICLTKK